MAHFLPPELVRQVNKLEWPRQIIQKIILFVSISLKKNQKYNTFVCSQKNHFMQISFEFIIPHLKIVSRDWLT